MINGRNVHNAVIATFAVISFSSYAMAGPIQWTASGITFNGGGQVSGSFDYDADTNSFTNIDLTTPFDTNAFQYLDTSNPDDTNSAGAFLFTDTASSDLTGAQVLYVVVNPALSGAGGTAPLAVLEEGTCANATCAGQPASHDTESGEFVASSAPEPGSWALTGAGGIVLSGVAFGRRRRTAPHGLPSRAG